MKLINWHKDWHKADGINLRGNQDRNWRCQNPFLFVLLGWSLEIAARLWEDVSTRWLLCSTSLPKNDWRDEKVAPSVYRDRLLTPKVLESWRKGRFSTAVAIQDHYGRTCSPAIQQYVVCWPKGITGICPSFFRNGNRKTSGIPAVWQQVFASVPGDGSSGAIELPCDPLG